MKPEKLPDPAIPAERCFRCRRPMAFVKTYYATIPGAGKAYADQHYCRHCDVSTGVFYGDELAATIYELRMRHLLDQAGLLPGGAA